MGGSARPWFFLVITQRSGRGVEKTGHPTLWSFKIMQEKRKTLPFRLSMNFGLIV